ncbi:MAG: SapC family protein [Oceanicaulis sp.]|nr:SapC family protein [Oceanicaulis sp.]
MADATANEPTIQGQLPLYKKPEPLSAQTHKGKGLTYTDRPFDFLKEAHFVPLTVGEFGLAASRFPIIFLGDNRTPVAAMGLQAGGNLFVNPQNGLYEENCYLPAFVRRYPFVAASHGDESDRFTVCVDTGSHLFSDKPEEPFFKDDGSATPFLERAIDYVRRFENDVAATIEFVKELRDLDLFDQQQTNFQPRDAEGNPAGEPQVVASYWGVSGEKLKALPADQLAKLRDSTALGAIYAHMISMGQWDFLIQRAARRQGQSQNEFQVPPAAPPPPSPEL